MERAGWLEDKDELAYEIRDDRQDGASIKSATKAINFSSGSPCDAAILQLRKPDVVDRHRSTCRADIVAESVSGSSEEALERMTVPACTQHEDAGDRTLYNPIMYALENVLSNAIPRKAFTPNGSEPRKISDVVWLSSNACVLQDPLLRAIFPDSSCIKIACPFQQACGSQRPANLDYVGSRRACNLCNAPDNGASHQYRQAYELRLLSQKLELRGESEPALSGTMGMNEQCDTISFKVRSHILDIFPSSSPSFMEADDFATKEVACSVFRVCVLNSKWHAAGP
jgi:hypothetical protein